MYIYRRMGLMTEKEIVTLGKNNPGTFLDAAVQFQQVMMVYESAIKEMVTKLEILEHEFRVKGEHVPIKSVESRVKSPLSIARKLQKNGYDITLDNIKDQLHDVAGVRIICPYITDVYTVADILSNQKDVRVVETKDYIKNPKKSGYRSLHLIAQMPVHLANKTEIVLLELQFRTISMDSWATLEHEIRYKSPENQISSELARRLKSCADVMAMADEEMENIAQQLEPRNKTQLEKLDLIAYDMQ